MTEFTDEMIEEEIQAKGLTAPRVTLADIEAAIVNEYYFTAGSAIHDMPKSDALGRLTFCVLVLKNGYLITGESACVSWENFDAELGRKIARRNAIDKCWPLFGFHLASVMAPE